MKCWRCGSDLAKGEKFCGKCGIVLGQKPVWRKKEILLKTKAKDTAEYVEEAFQRTKDWEKGQGNKYFESYGWEYYKGDSSDYRYKRACYYREHLYYLKADKQEKTYICVSDKKGADAKILAELTDIDEDFCWKSDWRDGYSEVKICVNDQGIYVFVEEDEEGRFCNGICIRHFDFNGQSLKKFKEKYPGGSERGHIIRDAYIWNDHVYYIHEHNHKAELRCADLNDDKSIVLYDKAASLDKVYVTEGKIIVYADYKKYDRLGEEELNEGGWMLLDPSEGTIESLNNPYCNPENVLDNPEVYNEESAMYNVNCDYYRQIKFFDFARGIFWVRKYIKDTYVRDYYEPRNLWGNRDVIDPHQRVWKMPDTPDYFDSEFCFVASSYYDFYSIDASSGERINWKPNHDGHGDCEQFRVYGETVFLDRDAFGEKAYSLDAISYQPTPDSYYRDRYPFEIVESKEPESSWIRLGGTLRQGMLDEFQKRKFDLDGWVFAEDDE